MIYKDDKEIFIGNFNEGLREGIGKLISGSSALSPEHMSYLFFI